MSVRFLEDLNVNGAVKISDGLSAGTPLLDLHNSTNGAGAQIRFTDVAAGTSQLGSIIYRHQDSKSYGSAASFEIGSAESSTTILANGKLMYSEGIYSKPSTGTGAGTRKDSNWDTAYGWGNHSTQGYLTAETNVFLGDGGNLLTAPGYNKLIFTGQISSGVSGLFPASDNSNSVITLNRHNGNYDSQLGFSSNGNVYYRKFSNTAINTTQGWGQLLITDTNGNIVPPGTVDGVDIAARDAVLTSTTTTANAALPKTGGTMTGTLKAATLEGASFTNRFRKMSVLPGGYIEPNALNFRFDESQTAYAGESHGIGGTINQTSGTTIPDASLKRLFTFTSSYINLNTYKDASNNVVIELTDIALSNSANTSWRPYVFFHSAASSVASMTIELKDGNNNWETVENAIDCVDFYMYNGFYTLSPGILRGARFTFTNITGNSYLRMIGVIGKTVEPYQWNVLKSGSKMFGDLDFADSKKATFGNSDDLYLLHDGSHSYISQGGTGNLYIQQNTNDADMIFQCDNGSGGTSIYMMLDGSESRISTKVNNRFDDNVKLELGTSGDLDLLHDGSNSYIHHNGAGSLYMKADTGDINIINYTNDRDIILQSDDGSGGVTPYLTIDGSATRTNVHKNMLFDDSVTLGIGSSYDLQLYHNGGTSLISNQNGNLLIRNQADDSDIIFQADDGSGGETAYLTLDGSTTHSYFSAGNVGIGQTSPQTLLHLTTAMSSSPTTQLYLDVDGSNTNGGGGEIIFNTSASAGSPTLYNAKITGTRASGGTGGDSQLGFWTTLVSSSTSPQERMTITKEGNVGIGTTSPDHLLQVESSGNAEIQAQRASGAGVLIQAQSAVGVVGTNTNHRLDLKTNSSTRATISTSGNFGIGTTSPAYKLSVNGDVQSDIFRGYTYPNNSFLDFDKDDTAVVNYTALASVGRIAYLADTNGNEPVANAAHEFFTGTSDIDTATSLMVIETDGNVGIGTTSPDTLLEVSKSTGAAVRITSTATGNGADVTLGSLEYYGNDASVPGAGIKSSIVAKTEASLGDDSNLIFSTSNGTTNNIERLRISSSGNVGIGTTSPSSALDVHGAITLSASSNEIIKSNGSIRLNIDSDNNQGDRIFIVSTGSNSELFRVDEGGHGEFQGNATVNGNIELGHASDTTIARASAGKVTIEGQPIQTKQMSMTHHNFFMNSSSTTTDFFIPYNNLNESSNPTNSIYYGRMVAPYDGRIVKVVLHTTAAIGTACQVLFWVATSAGVFAPSAAETVTGVNLNTANTSATATFSTTSTAEFDEGDVLGVSIIKSSSATANMQVTVVWEYTV